MFSINVTQFLPVPDRFFTVAGSTAAAATLGGVYALIGRVIYPKAGIYPLNYALWFTLAYHIKQGFNLLEERCGSFIGVSTYLEELKQISGDELNIKDQIRYHCWKIICWKNKFLQKMDQISSRILHLRSYQEVNASNVYDASFLEMCRYRIWPVFKCTILDMISVSLAYRLSNGMGFTLPNRTTVPLIIVIQSIIKDIILVPALYVYIRFCDQLADEYGEQDKLAAAYRAMWIQRLLPVL